MHFFNTTLGFSQQDTQMWFIWFYVAVCIWSGHLVVLPSKDLTGEIHLEIGTTLHKVCFYECYKSQILGVHLSFLWLWKEVWVSNPGKKIFMVDISSQVGWIPVWESGPDNTSMLPVSYDGATISLHLLLKERKESFIILKQWCHDQVCTPAKKSLSNKAHTVFQDGG